MIDIKVNAPLPKLFAGEDVAIDLEMFGQREKELHIPHGEFACLSFSIERDGCITGYVFTNQDMAMAALEQSKIGLWIMHNASYDIKQLQRFHPIQERPVWDTMLVERVLWNGYYSTFSLDNLVRRYFNYHMDKTVREQFETATSMSSEQIIYAAYDAIFTLMVKRKQQSLDRNLNPYWEFEVSSLWTAMKMEPVRIDKVAWSNALKGFQQEVDTIQKRIGVNANSYKKVQEQLKERFGIDVPSTGEKILSEYTDIPWVADILLSRRYKKAISSYGKSWFKKTHEGDVLIGDWGSIGTETFRWACSNPALQTVPARKLPIYRTFFIPKRDLMYVVDISQQEPRILAFLSKDKGLREIFDSGMDIHSGVAQRIYKDNSIQKGDPRRKVGKEINLAISYGITPPGLVDSVNKQAEDASQRITLPEAEEIINQYFTMFPGVKEYINDYRKFAAIHGYIESVGGHRIWINPYSHSAQNNAINAPIQTTAAEITKQWTDQTRFILEKKLGKWPCVLTIHDELVLDIFENEVDFITSTVLNTLEVVGNQILPGIPLECEYAWGDSWGVKA